MTRDVIYKYRVAERKSKGMKKTAIVTAISLAAIATEYYIALADSNNVTRYLRNPVEECMSYEVYPALQFVKQNKDAIIDAAKKADVPAELVAAALISENAGRPKYEDLKEWMTTGTAGKVYDYTLGPIIGFFKPHYSKSDPSLGPGQVKVSTAQSIDAKLGLGQKSRSQLEEELQMPNVNITTSQK